MNKSIATINSPEFINLRPLDISPLISACDIKVLYLNENRNHSFITKDVATEMAKSLRGSPIVAAFSENTGDFTDHGEVVTMDSEGVHFSCNTKPYGFVSPDAKVWFQDFEDIDEYGVTTVRTYLMTTGYLWTGAYPEAQLAIDEGRAQSMELDENTIQGHWSIKGNSNIKFYIIDDAIFTKLCILGEDVEPCFEGASVTAPEISKNFTMDNNFTKSLYDMMIELKFALEGGKMNMENIATPILETPVEPTVDTPAVEVPTETNFNATLETSAENSENSQGNDVQTVSAEIQENIETPVSDTFAKEDDEEKKCKNVCANPTEDKKDEEEDEEKKKYELLQTQYSELQSKFAELQTNFSALVDFKNQVETEKKENLLTQFSLDEQTINDFKSNLSKYSYDELESKLSIIESRARRAASATVETTHTQDKTPITTFAINSCSCDDEITAALKAQRERN